MASSSVTVYTVNPRPNGSFSAVDWFQHLAGIKTSVQGADLVLTQELKDETYFAHTVLGGQVRPVVGVEAAISLGERCTHLGVDSTGIEAAIALPELHDFRLACSVLGIPADRVAIDASMTRSASIKCVIDGVKFLVVSFHGRWKGPGFNATLPIGPNGPMLAFLWHRGIAMKDGDVDVLVLGGDFNAPIGKVVDQMTGAKVVAAEGKRGKLGNDGMIFVPMRREVCIEIAGTHVEDFGGHAALHPLIGATIAVSKTSSDIANSPVTIAPITSAPITTAKRNPVLDFIEANYDLGDKASKVQASVLWEGFNAGTDDPLSKKKFGDIMTRLIAGVFRGRVKRRLGTHRCVNYVGLRPKTGL